MTSGKHVNPTKRLFGRRLTPPVKISGNGHYGVRLSLSEAVLYVGCSRISVVTLLQFWGLPNTSIPVSVLDMHLDELTETARRRTLTEPEFEAYRAWRLRHHIDED